MAIPDESTEATFFRDEYIFPHPHRGVLRATASRANERLVMFVHGFAGHPITTWAELSILMSEDAAFQDYDLCFTGYGVSVASVTTLGMYLKDVLGRALNGSHPFPKRYQEVFIVAHSLGGVAVRSALLYLAGEAPEAFRRVRACILAAPALFGCQEGLPKLVIRLLTDFGLFLVPVVRDLKDARGEIRRIREEYDNLMQTTPSGDRPKNETYWALYDRVVAPPVFGYQPKPPDTQAALPFTHASIIRPLEQGHYFYAALVSALCGR